MSETWERVSGWAEGDNDGLPNFGRKARKWFLRKLRAKLDQSPYNLESDELEAVLDWFATDPMPYVEWDDADEYHGRQYSNGSWSIDWEAVREGCKAALTELRAEAEQARFPTLDHWLRAEIEGTLDSSGARGGSAELPKKLRRELQAAARARRRNRPRICRACHGEFTPTCNRALRCAKCIGSDEATKPGTARKADRREN